MLGHLKRKSVDDGLMASDDCTYEPDPKASRRFQSRNLVWSKRSYVIDEVLILSNRPRLLISANKPYSVVHANAAFYHYRNGLDIHVQALSTNPENAEPENLEDVIKMRFKDETVYVYRVWGSIDAIITHYLAEIDREVLSTLEVDASLTVG